MNDARVGGSLFLYPAIRFRRVAITNAIVRNCTFISNKGNLFVSAGDVKMSNSTFNFINQDGSEVTKVELFYQDGNTEEV